MEAGVVVERGERTRERDTEEEEGKTVDALGGPVFIRPVSRRAKKNGSGDPIHFFWQEMIESVKILLNVCRGKVRYEN